MARVLGESTDGSTMDVYWRCPKMLILSGIWSASHSLAAPFMVVGVRALEVTALGPNEWQMSDQAPGTPSISYAELVKQLEQGRWRISDRREHHPLICTYRRTSWFGVGDVQEGVVVRL